MGVLHGRRVKILPRQAQLFVRYQSHYNDTAKVFTSTGSAVCEISVSL